jgi:hypothetical protein
MAAGALTLFVNDDIVTLAEEPGRGESGDSAPDDGDFKRFLMHDLNHTDSADTKFRSMPDC